MPKKMERKLKRQARRKFGTTTSKKAKKYIYGTMQKNSSWKPGKKKK